MPRQCHLVRLLPRASISKWVHCLRIVDPERPESCRGKLTSYQGSGNQGSRCHQDSFVCGSCTALDSCTAGFGFAFSLGFGVTAQGVVAVVVAAAADATSENLVISIMLGTLSPESDNGSEPGVLMTISRPKGACSDAAAGADLGILGTTDSLASAAAAGMISVLAETSSCGKMPEALGMEA